MSQALLTRELERTLPPVKSGGKVALVKFFAPWTHWTWYAAEASAELADGSEVPLTERSAGERVDVLFWGLVFGHEQEYGYWRLSELESVRGPFGLRIERDVAFDPTPLEECRDPTGRL